MRWILLILALCSPSWAATHYVWCAAAGAATGNDWTNALTDIPDTQVRGDTYVVAGVSGGCSYGPTAAKTYKEFATAESGTTLITIRHASSALDAGVAGWNSTFSTTQALWSATHFSGTTQMWVIRAGYYKFDGNPDKTSVIGVGSTTCYDVCGFKLVDAADFKPTGFILITCSSNPCTAPTFKGVEIDNTGVTITTTCSDGLTSSGTWNNVTLAMSYIHDVGGPFNLTAAGSGFSATNNIIARNQSSSSCHGEHISLADQTTIDIHYNTLQDCTGTGCIVQLAGTTKISSGSIYGNVFNNTTPGTYTEGNGVYSCQDSQVCTIKFFNNTITGFTGAGTSRVDSAGAGGGTAITVNNNLWYNNAAVNPAGVGMSNDYNCYESTTDASNPSEAHACTGSTNYIANIGSSDFHLSSETPSNGLNTNSLLAANTTDPDGRNRSASTDGIWSRGAFQFAPPLSGQYYAPLSPAASPYLTVDMNSNSQWPDGVANPLVRMNCVRIWDTPGASGWAQVETSAGSYVFTSLDSTLTRAQANGVNCAFYPLNRTPTFYSSNTADISCGYYLSIGTGTATSIGTALTRSTGTNFSNTWTTIIYNGTLFTVAAFIDINHITLGSSAGTNASPLAFNTPSTNAGSGPGQCDIPTDINPDGTGTNLHYKNWVAALATHIKATFPTMQMYYEFYNEPDTCKFFQSDAATQGTCTGTGTLNDLVRWEWDSRCIIKGVTSNNPFIGGQSCTTSQGLVTSVVMAGAVDATAKLLMGSYHGAPFSYNLAQNFLYCNHTPVPANCTAGRAGADNTDAINFHFKYLGKPAVQGDATTTLEPVADTWIAGMVAILQPTELHIPWYNTEGGAAAGGWVDCAVTSGVPTCNFFSEPLMEAGAVARNNIYQVWKGATNAVWYDWPSSGGHGLGSVNDVNHFTDQAYDQSGQWISGATGMICLTTPPGTVHAGLFTYTCTFRNAQGQAKAAIWDNSQTCSSGTCSTTNQTVAKSYVSYTDLTGTTTPIVSSIVPVGIRPILLNVGASSGGISGVTLKGLTAKVGTPLGPPLYPGSSTSVAALGTISSPFSAATLFNSTAHGPLNPGTNCILRFIDQNVVQFGTSTAMDDNFSQGNLSASGGNNDVMTNTDTSYIGIRANGGTTWIFKTAQSGGCLQNSSNGGENPSVSVPGAFGFSRDPAKPLVFYNLQNTHLLDVNTLVPGTPLTFTTAGSPFDFTDCPGVAALVAHGTSGTSASILGIGLLDAYISADISWDGGQGTAHFGMVYKPGTGCATLDLGPTALLSGTASIVANVATVTTAGRPNMAIGLTAAITGASNTNFNCATATITNSTASTVSYTCSPALTNTGSLTLTTGTMIGNFGNVYAYCAASCATAVPIGSETVCYDNAYASGSGIHDGNITLNGNILRLAGGCFNLAAGNSAFWQVNTTNVMGRATGTSTCNPGTPYSFSGHPSDGVNHLILSNDPTPNIRAESTVCGDYISLTSLASLPAGASGAGGFHGGWAHPNGDDSLAWTMESANNVGFTTPGSMTLTYLENEIFGLQTDNSAQPIIRFGPTYNSSNSGGFACQDGIGYVSQDGKWAFFLSDGFENLGLDSASAQLCSVFTMALQ